MSLSLVRSARGTPSSDYAASEPGATIRADTRIDPITARFVALLALLVVLAAPAAASAGTRDAIIRDCGDDSRLSKTYTPGELRDARDNLPADALAYTDCIDVLRSALRASARSRAAASNATAQSSTPGSSPGSSAAAAPRAPGPALDSLDTDQGQVGLPHASQEALRALRSARTNLPEVDIRGQRVVPGISGTAGAAADSELPTSLLVVLVLLGLTALLAIVPAARRALTRRRDAKPPLADIPPHRR